MKVKGASAGSAVVAGISGSAPVPSSARAAGLATPMRVVPDAAPRGRKVVKSAADLAINGAPPMFAEPLHVGRPNIGDHQRFLRRASEILDRGWLSNNGPVAQEFE